MDGNPAPGAPQRGGEPFRTLCVVHDPECSADATLVLAARAAFAGLRVDGTAMDNPHPRVPSMREVAIELGLSSESVSRGDAELRARGELSSALEVDAESLAARWQRDSRHRRVIRLPAAVRRLGLRSRPLLVTGLVHGQVDERGRLVLGLGFLGERTGLARRTLQRALQSAEARGALHRWVAPMGRGQLVLAPGPSETGAREAPQSGARETPPLEQRREPEPPGICAREAPQTGAREGASSTAKPANCKEARVGTANRRTCDRKEAHPPLQTGARHPDCLPEYVRSITRSARAR